MDTKTPDLVDPVVEIAKLTAEVAAERHLLDGLDDSIGLLYETRKSAVNRLWDKEAKLRRLEHYAALAAEAEAVAS